ncbi:probable glutamate receptor isoform X1 [Astyanax mexicanus]|uniref:Glutamate receptor n=2 Tax=Astyanax mexicanus TaxID=7994 RepID=A0A3B1JH02_ASTMX|nr:probable glutamate receptor isoform X1 [Astyanax mexicanus]XP_049327847.1 probable glutamate receptor isoform X1 [Astyanax mexicanus]
MVFFNSMWTVLAFITFATVLLLSNSCSAAKSELTVTTIKQDPYTMLKGSQLEGYCMDLLSELAKKLGFKYKVHLVKDGSYGRLDESGNWNGMIGEVVRGEADLAVAPLTLTAAREKAVGMTKPYMQTGISILMRRDITSEDSSMFDFLSPFSGETWFGILVAYILTAVCICVVARVSPCEWSQPESEQNPFTLLHSLWYIAGALSLQGAGPHPRSPSGRVVSCTWWLFAVVLLACYFSNLSSNQSSDSSHLMIKGFEDLANQDIIEYGTLAGSSTLAFFKNSNNPSYRRIYEHMERRKSFVSSMDEGVQKARDGNFAFIGESVSLDLAVARYCELVRAHEVIGMRGYSIVTPLNFPMLKNLSVAILQLSEAGELAYLRSKWWASSCMAQSAKGSSLRAQSMKGIFLVLAVGLGLGVLLALLELTSKSRSRAQEQKKSCCSVLTQELSQRLRTNSPKREPETSEKNKA